MVVVISSTKPGCRTITNVSLRLILGPVLFNIFINELKDGTECANSKVADDKFWGEVADTPDGYVALLPFQGSITVGRNKQTS